MKPSKLKLQDMKAIAEFHAVVKNYIKMQKLINQ